MANNGLLASRLAKAKTDPSSTQSQTPPAQDLAQNQQAQPFSGIQNNATPNNRPQTEDMFGRFDQEDKEETTFYQTEEPKKTEAELEIEELRRRHMEQKKQSRWKMSTRVINIFLVAACMYVLFLIYGVLVTNYQYSDDGTIVAQKLSISEIAEKKSYETIYYQYLNCRVLYEEVLILDYRIGKGEEDPLTIAPEYELLLDEVELLSIRTDALEVETQYNQIKNLLLTWIRDDIAVYLQNMSSAISQNNAESANNALQDKDRVYSHFSIITQNIVAMGENLKGVDLTVVREWTPENYVDKEINGK